MGQDGVKIITQTDEEFYVHDNLIYWSRVYIKERPELMPPYKSVERVSSRFLYWDQEVGLGTNIFKERFIKKKSCETHDYDFELPLEKTLVASEEFYVYQFYKDKYYVHKDYQNKYKELRDLTYIEKVKFGDDRCFAKIDEGLYRNRRLEVYVYVSSEYVYLVNKIYLYKWNAYKEKMHPKDKFYIKHIFEIQTERESNSVYAYSSYSSLSPIYTEEEIIGITNGISRTRNIIPEKVDKKYIVQPSTKVEPHLISNRDDYLVENPEFFTFKTYHGEEYLINISNIEEWSKMIDTDMKKYACALSHKKYMYAVQPFEYQVIKKGIYIKNKRS